MYSPTYLILALTFLGAITWFIRKTLSGSPGLQNLPGPPSPSWLKGTYPPLPHPHTFTLLIAPAIAGNIQQLMGRHSNEWNRQNAETYGPLSRLAGPFSVSNGLSPTSSVTGPYVD